MEVRALRAYMGSRLRTEAESLSKMQVALLGQSKAEVMAKRKYDVANCPICGSEVRIRPDSSGIIRPWTLIEPSNPEDILDVSTIPCEGYQHPVKVYRIKPFFKSTSDF
jgi:hypothetical protein